MKVSPSLHPTSSSFHSAQPPGYPAPMRGTSFEPSVRRLRRGQRILLVDDDPGVRASISEVLVSEGYVVIPANDGQQALNLVASIQVDLVLLDLNMPVKNGWDTFERLSAEHALIPVIIATARPNQFFMALNSGAGALLEKPMDIPILLRTIKELLAESADERLARLTGASTKFYYRSTLTNG